MRCVLMALAGVALLGTPRALRRKAQRSNASGSAKGRVQTTVRGCTCKASSQCDADVGTLFKCDTCKTEAWCGTISLLGRWDYCNYRPSTAYNFIESSSAYKLDYFWNKVTADTTRYPKFPLLSNILTSMRTTFDNYQPEMPAGREKMIHTVGSVCKFELKISDSSPYTGLLSPGTQKGLIRMGGALDPTDGITPGLGFKLPRSGFPDGDFVMLHSLRAGDQWNFFLNNQSNHLEPVSGGATSVLVAKFKEASQCPYQVGLSDLARYSQDGTIHRSPRFPFKLFMTPNSALKTGTLGETVDAVHSEIDAIPVGSTLYTVYACRNAAGDEYFPSEDMSSCGNPLLLGEVKTTSRCTTSRYGDASLHIRHQRIEEDWQLEPSYLKQGKYDANTACGARVDFRTPPEMCGAEGMMNSDA